MENTIRTIEIEKREMEADGYKYIKTDRNGTRYYSTCRCPKCGGTGRIWVFSHVEGGVCFKCDGSGVTEKPRVEKIMTEEYAAKLEEKRQARAKEKAKELNKEFLERQGFNENGITYAVLGNTYKIKDELKKLGAKYDSFIGWHLPQETTDYPTIEVSVDEVYLKDWAGKYDWRSTDTEKLQKLTAKIKEANTELNRASSKSQHIGSVGDKIEKTVTLTRISSYVTSYTYYGEEHFVYNFVDEFGNVLVWKTSKAPDEFNNELKKDSTVTVKGTIKEHSEYNGEPQTVLTRCKIS